MRLSEAAEETKEAIHNSEVKSLDLFETFENVDIDKMTCEAIISELKQRRDFSENGVKKMITKSNLRTAEINVTPKLAILIYPSTRDLDDTTNPLYTSEEDRPENKATIRTIQEELAKNVIQDEEEDNQGATHEDNFLNLQCQIVIQIQEDEFNNALFQ